MRTVLLDIPVVVVKDGPNEDPAKSCARCVFNVMHPGRCPRRHEEIAAGTTSCSSRDDEGRFHHYEEIQ